MSNRLSFIKSLLLTSVQFLVSHSSNRNVQEILLLLRNPGVKRTLELMRAQWTLFCCSKVAWQSSNESEYP
jgi:hypothetical protein